ncbi:transcription antitermination factor NusB [Verrucomicrobiales bacterium]|nr:transcription antitermination factor NusB [Verrucomicrobiales bacterium]
MDSSGKSERKSKKKAPSPRRDGREAAVQYLYGNDISGEVDFSPERVAEFWEIRLAKSFAQEFTAELLGGIQDHLPEIDRAIRERLDNFAFERLTAVDRNILRLGTYEIRFTDHIPPQAAINEAIEIAKRFGTEESPGFINGILDKILKS